MGLKKKPTIEDVEDAAGLPARRFAFSLVTRVLDRRATLDEAGAALANVADRMPARDVAFARAIAYAALRRKGSLEAVIARFLDRPLPEHGLAASRVLLCGAAELLVLDGKHHAAVDGANRLALATREAKPFKPLVNAVLRRVATEGRLIFERTDKPGLDVPAWLWTRWTAACGAETAAAIAVAHRAPAPLDLTLKEPAAAQEWAERLGAARVGASTLRLTGAPSVETLPGFDEGAWWVQDAAAAIPARALLDHLGDPAGRRVLDLCAAPGGKTLQLAAAGADVTALDSSAARLKRLAANLQRTGLDARIVAADARSWRPDAPFDAILLDAPCSATGTIRRHPELPWIRDEGAIVRNAALSARLLDAAWPMLAPGGALAFAVCSLEPEEGERQIEAFVTRVADARVQPLDASRYGLPAQASVDGGLRILPSMLPESGGLDGFFVAVLKKG